MKAFNIENLAFGRAVLASLANEGLIPQSTTSLRLVVDSESFVRVELEYCPEHDQVMAMIHKTIIGDAKGE